MKGDFECPYYCHSLQECAQKGIEYHTYKQSTATTAVHEELIGYFRPKVGCLGNKKNCEVKK